MLIHSYLQKHEKNNYNTNNDNNNNEVIPKPKLYNNIIKPYDFFSLNEIQISQIITKIPNYSHHFNPVLKSSFINIATIDTENFERCENINNENKHVLLTKLNILNCKSFFDIFYSNIKSNKINNNTIIQDQDNIINQKSKNLQSKKNILNLINSYTHLLKSLIYLENLNIINLNFHPSIILFNNNLPIITNFEDCFIQPNLNENNLAQPFLKVDFSKVDFLKVDFLKVDSRNVFLSIETHVICYLLQNNIVSLTRINIEEISKDCENRLYSLNCFTNTYISDYKNGVNLSLEKYINKSQKYIINNILEKCNTWNMYGISILFLVLIRDVFKEDIIKKNTFISSFFQQLINNIHYDSTKRNDISTNILLFDSIICNYNMTSTTGIFGRFGNQIIRNLAVSLIAEKHDLKVNYYNKDLIKKLGIELFSGNNLHTSFQTLADDNYFDIYNSDILNYNLDANGNFFQTKEITNFLYNYLHTDKIKSNIIENNPFKDKYNKNNDLFVHIRLDDVEKYTPGITYYINAIKNINFDNLYISTDDINHDIIKELLKLFPSAELINYDEITTFQFASVCKHIVLSHGSFSAIIGYLSFFSNIYYPEYEPNKQWYGDIFSINNWIKLSDHLQ